MYKCADYLYLAEAVRADFAVQGQPVVGQALGQVALQLLPVVSALQELLSLLAAAGIVLPKSLPPL